MGLISVLKNMVSFRGTKLNPKHPRDPAVARLFDYGAGSETGINVSANSAFRIAAAVASIKVIAETYASLPLHLYERIDSGGKKLATNHSLFNLLYLQPNPNQTSYEFRFQQMVDILTQGASYALISHDGRGGISRLDRIDPNRMRPFWAPDGNKAFAYLTEDNQQKVLLGDEVYELMGLSKDGLTAMSPIEACAETFGISLAAERYGARFFGNDSRPGGYLKHPENLGEEAQKRLVESWQRRYAGIENSHKIAILEEGMEFQEVGIKPEQAQFLETRKFQREEIAGIFRVPPHMIGVMDNATFSNIEHQSLSFITSTMQPWITNAEQKIASKLLTKSQRNKYYVKFNVAGMLRGDIKTRYESYAQGRQWGWLSADDIRALEDMNPLPDGKGEIYLQPLNMIEAGTDPDPVEGRQKLLPVLDKAAERVVLKEVKSLRTALDKGIQPDWIEQFYQGHADFICKTLGLSAEQARSWCDRQAEAFSAATDQTALLEDWLHTAPAQLSKQVMEAS